MKCSDCYGGINWGYVLLERGLWVCCTPFIFLLLFENCLFDMSYVFLLPLLFILIGTWLLARNSTSMTHPCTENDCEQASHCGIYLPPFFPKCFNVAQACNNKLGRKLELIIWFWMHKPCQISPQAWSSRSSCDTSKLNPGGSWPEVMKCVLTILMLSVLRHTDFTF